MTRRRRFPGLAPGPGFLVRLFPVTLLAKDLEGRRVFTRQFFQELQNFIQRSARPARFDVIDFDAFPDVQPVAPFTEESP